MAKSTLPYSNTHTVAPARPASQFVRTTSRLGQMGRRLWKYMRRNFALPLGLFLLLAVVLFCSLGTLLWDTSKSNPLSVAPSQPPSAKHPLGSDRAGRDMLAVMIAGTPLTLKIALVAGVLGLGLGIALAFVAAYYGRVIDTFISGAVDVGLTVPSLLLLVVIAVSIKESLTVNQMALVVASTAWLWPARKIRSQVLSLKERAWVDVARLSGMSGPEIIVKELMPNLIPYLSACLVDSVQSAIMASIGLEALGLGPMNSPTLGMTIYWAIYFSALLHGMWWWWAPPIVIIVIVFIGFFLVSAGLDEMANPRLRRAA